MGRGWTASLRVGVLGDGVFSAKSDYKGFPTKVKQIPTAMNRMAIDGAILFP